MSFYSLSASYGNPSNEIVYNEQKWSINIFLYSQFDYQNNAIYLQNSKIISISIIDQMGLYGQHIQIIYSDTEINSDETKKGPEPLTSMFKPNNTFLSVNIKQPPLLQQRNKQIGYHGDFMISEIQILSNDTQSILYKIAGMHVNYLTLMQNINYATDKTNDNKKYTFDIISEILENKSVNYPIAKIPANNYKGKLIDFITYKNMRIMQVIQYCLAVSIDKSIDYNKIYFFVHNMLQNKAYLISQSADYQFMTNPINMSLTIQGKKQQDSVGSINILSDSNLITNISTQQTYGGVLSMANIYKIGFYDYSHIDRKWTYDGYTYDNIKKILKTDQNTVSLLPSNDILNKYEYLHTYSNYMHGIQYETFKKLYLTTNISFNIRGDLSRAAGQFLNIKSESHGIVKQFGNLWQIYRCIHRWQRWYIYK